MNDLEETLSYLYGGEQGYVSTSRDRINYYLELMDKKFLCNTIGVDIKTRGNPHKIPSDSEAAHIAIHLTETEGLRAAVEFFNLAGSRTPLDEVFKETKGNYIGGYLLLSPGGEIKYSRLSNGRGTRYLSVESDSYFGYLKNMPTDRHKYIKIENQKVADKFFKVTEEKGIDLGPHLKSLVKDHFLNRPEGYPAFIHMGDKSLVETQNCYGIENESVLAQYILFGINEKFGTGGIKIDEAHLKTGGIYSILRGVPMSYNSTKKRIVFEHRGEYDSLYIGPTGEIEDNTYNLFYGYRDQIYLATPEEIELFKKAKRRRERRIRAERVAERELKIQSRKNKSHKQKMSERLEKFNGDLGTQLISSSLHKILHKRLDSRIAVTLMKLNQLGHFKGVIRNISSRMETGELAFLPKNKDCELGDTGWRTKNRQTSKAGKLLRKVLAEQVPKFKYSDQELEYLVNHIKAETDNGSFSIVRGDDIMEWYDGECYEDQEDTGTLECSCMRHNPEYMQLYANNSCCELIILVKDGKLRGRALLWNGKYMDRIYGSDSVIRSFKNYAVENGYHSKSAQNSNNLDEWIHPETGDEYTEVVTIQLDNLDNDYYPYADTFYFLDEENMTLSNSAGRQHTAEMRCTEGGLDGDGYVWDEYNERTIDRDEAIWLEYEDIYVHSDDAIYCDLNQGYYLRDDMVQIRPSGDWVYKEYRGIVEDYNGNWWYKDDAYECEHSNVVYSIHEENRVFLEELDMYVASSCVNDAYADNGYQFCDERKEWIHQDELEKVTK